MTQELTPVTVHILGKEYRIACEPDERTGLLDSARLLDERMREVRQHGRVIGADRIAVMAALNLVYELMKNRQSGSVDGERLGRLQQRIGEAIDGSGKTRVDEAGDSV